MWNEVTALKNIVANDFRFEHENGTINLFEGSPGASLRNVVISDLSNEGITLKTDFKDKGQFFDKGTGSKRCDYIIISEYRGELIAVFVEMKSNANSGKKIFPDGTTQLGAIPQLKGSFCFLKYVSEVSKMFKDDASIDYFFTGNKVRYVILSGTPPTQIHTEILPTRRKPNIDPDNPKICHVTEGGTLSFNDLFTDMTED